MYAATTSSTAKIKDKLYTLNMAMDANCMKEAFTPIMKSHFGEKTQVDNVHIEVLRRRNQRCVLRYKVEGFDSKESKGIEWNVIGKVFKADRGERVFDDMKALWENGFSRDTTDGISMPEPLDFQSSLCLLFQEEIPGLPVKTLIRQEPSPKHFRQLARTLAKLHQCSIIPTKPFKVQDHLLRCHPRHEFLSLACPDLTPLVDHIVESSFEIEEKLGDIAMTPLHGDFHLGQVHMENGNSWLIDYDALSYGDPASDIGNLVVFLKGKARRKEIINDLIDAFLDEYFLIMDKSIADRIPFYEGLTHLRRACKCLRMQEDGWKRKVERMLKEGIACIDTMKETLAKKN